jgi:hypothetical protein
VNVSRATVLGRISDKALKIKAFKRLEEHVTTVDGNIILDFVTDNNYYFTGNMQVGVRPRARGGPKQAVI